MAMGSIPTWAAMMVVEVIAADQSSCAREIFWATSEAIGPLASWNKKIDAAKIRSGRLATSTLNAEPPFGFGFTSSASSCPTMSRGMESTAAAARSDRAGTRKNTARSGKP